MEFKDFYATMGVTPTATADEIKRAYRKLASKFHPDVSKETDATEQFKLLGEAYEVLKDPEKRATYDELRERRARGGGQAHGRRAGTSRGESFDEFGARGRNGTIDEDEFGEFFRSIFGGDGDFAGDPRGGPRSPGRRARSARGEDVRARLALTLEEAYAGTTQTIELRLAEGSGPAGARTLRVKIPAGVTGGQEIRLKGQGGAGVGGAANGHLFVQISIAPHPRFTLEGPDVLLRVPLAPWEAALGARIRVPTLAGAVNVTVPAGQSDGKRLRLKGRGMPGKTPADQFLVFQIHVPVPVDDAERALYRQLAELHHEDLRPDFDT